MGKDERKATPPEWAARFTKERKARSVSLATIAARLHLTEGAVRHWINGTRTASVNDFMRLCKAAGIDPGVILFDDAPNADGLTRSDLILARKINAMKGSKNGAAALTLIETLAAEPVADGVIEKAYKTAERPRIGGVISRPSLFNDDFSGPREGEKR